MTDSSLYCYYFNNMIKTFSEIVSQKFMLKNTIPDFVRANFPNRNSENMIRMIRRYVSGEQVPPYNTAREILTKLGEKYNERELMDILEYSRTVRSTSIEYRQALIIDRLNIKYQDLFIGNNMSMADKDGQITKRIEETTKSKTIKEYVIRLIEKDLKDIILENYKEEKRKK